MKNYWVIAIENILITAVFGAVAICSDHWWVVLFSMLGWTTIKSESKSNK